MSIRAEALEILERHEEKRITIVRISEKVRIKRKKTY